MIDIKVSLKGRTHATAVIEGLEAAGREALILEITRLTLGIHKRAVRGLHRGPKSGRVYEKYNPRRTHRASAPGEYPASDTGRLAGSIEFLVPDGSEDKLVGQVSTRLRYGAYLELKSPMRGGRPWLLRSFNQEVEGAREHLRRTYNAEARKKR